VFKKVRKAIIPAAGLGTRFLPATIAQPKEMLTIVDKPVIQYVVEEAVAAGITEILIVTGRGKRAIEDHFDPPYELLETLRQKGKIAELDEIEKISNLAKIHYIRQKRQLGLGDAILQGKYFVGDEPFVVLLGDTIITGDCDRHCLKDMIYVYEETGGSVVAAEYLKDPADSKRYGMIGYDKKVLTTDGSAVNYFKVTNLIEKPEPDDAPSRLAISARYLFNPEIFGQIEKTKAGVGGEIQITDAMRALAKKTDLFVTRACGKRFDIGNKADFIKTNIDFALQREDLKAIIRDYLKNLEY